MKKPHGPIQAMRLNLFDTDVSQHYNSTIYKERLSEVLPFLFRVGSSLKVRFSGIVCRRSYKFLENVYQLGRLLRSAHNLSASAGGMVSTLSATLSAVCWAFMAS